MPLTRERLVELLLRDLDPRVAEDPRWHAFAERVAEAILAALAEHERRSHQLSAEFGEEERER